MHHTHDPVHGFDLIRKRIDRIRCRTAPVHKLFRIKHLHMAEKRGPFNAADHRYSVDHRRFRQSVKGGKGVVIRQRHALISVCFGSITQFLQRKASVTVVCMGMHLKRLVRNHGAPHFHQRRKPAGCMSPRHRRPHDSSAHSSIFPGPPHAGKIPATNILPK